MKNKPKKLLFVCAGILFFASCRTETARQDIPGYRTLLAEKETPLFPGRGGDSPRLKISLSLLDTAPSSAESLRNLLWNTLYDGVSPEEYGNLLGAHYEAQYAGAAADLNASERPPEIMNWEYTETTKIETRTPQFLVISRNRDYYLGGAHGMQEKTYFVLSPAEPAQLKLEDLVRSRAELQPLLEEALRAQTGLKPGEPLRGGGFFEDTVTAPDNFFLSEEGLGFHWDPYEIAPYAAGPVEATIPYDRARPFLSSRGAALIP
ncbi:MAG: DUF3298 and DUF4163 domain-containing protein [Treponema sp.]|nr:DUF3298 and DUF4163 domain-containing protein [Treponema sp.]